MEKQSNKLFTNAWFVAAMALLCCALWGSASPAIKIGYDIIELENGDIPKTLLFAGVRFALAGVLTVIIYSIARRKFLLPKKKNWGKVLTVSAFQTVLQYIFFYIGLAYSTSVKGAVISGCNTFCSILIASLLFRQEKLNTKKIIACLVGFVGIILVNLNGLDFQVSFLGEGFVFLSTVCYGMSSTLIKIFSKDEDPVVISGYQFAIGGAVMAIAGIIFGGRMDILNPAVIGILLYLAALSAIAYSLWGVLLKYNSVSKVTIYSFMIPVFGAILSIILRSEETVSYLNLGMALVLICGGILLLNLKKANKE